MILPGRPGINDSGLFAALWSTLLFWRSFFFRSTEASHIAAPKAIWCAGATHKMANGGWQNRRGVAAGAAAL